LTLSNDVATGKISISWKEVAGALSYEVYRSTDKAEWTLLSKTTETSILDQDTVAGTLYYYKAKAIAKTSSANSAFSKIPSRTCDLPQPTVVLTNIPENGRVLLSWVPVEGATKYKVYRAEAGLDDFTCVRTTADTSYTDTTALSGTVYYYKIIASCENSAANSAASMTYPGEYQMISSLTVSIQLNDQGKPRLSWNEIKDAVQYQVYRATSLDGNYTLRAETDNTRYENTGAALGIRYYYKVYALNALGEIICESTESVSIEVPLPEGETLETQYVLLSRSALYELPDAESEYFYVPYMTELKLGMVVTSNSSGCWYRTYYKDDLYYVWIGNDEVKLTDQKSDFTYTGNTPYQQQVIDMAADISLNWNTIYANGQSTGEQNPDGTYGFDCSGLVKYVTNTVMQKDVPTYWIPGNTTILLNLGSIYNAGYDNEFCTIQVSLSGQETSYHDIEDLQPGDVLFFSQSEPNNHCGIYLGNGEFAHSCGAWDGASISPLTDMYWEQLTAIRRYIPTVVAPANQEMFVVINKCNLFEAMDSENSDSIHVFAKGETVTVLFTNSDNWAYVRRSDGQEGFILLKNLSEEMT